MKRLMAGVMSVVLAVGLIPAPAYADSEAPAASRGLLAAPSNLLGSAVEAVDTTFADENLYNAVVEQLGARKVDFETEASAKRVKLTAASNARLTELALNNKEITDISGLEAFTGLTRLDLSHNLVRTTEQFAGMKRLEHLDLYDNAVRDFSGLRGLTALKELNLGDNNEVSQSALSGLDAIDTLKGLTSLDFSRNGEPTIVKHVSGLAGLTFLNLQQNGIKDVADLKGLKKLKTLILCYNDISGVSALAGCTALEELNLQCNQLYKTDQGEDKSGIDGLFDGKGDFVLGNLKKLDLWGNWDWNGFMGAKGRSQTAKLQALRDAGKLEFGISYDRLAGFDTSGLPHVDADGEYVTYDDFGAYCDDESRAGGIRDDFNAIRNAHRFANAKGCEVRAAAGRTYHIFRYYDLEYHSVYTNVDWKGANFVIHDENIDGYAVRYVPLLCLRPYAAAETEKAAAYSEVVTIPNPLSESAGESARTDKATRPYYYADALTVTKVPGKNTNSIADMSPEVSAALEALNAKGFERYYVMVYDAQTRHYKRFGINSSSDQWDGFIVDGDGKLERTDPTPVQWDFTGLTKVVITPIPSKRAFVGNGNFVSVPLESKAETPYSRGGGKPIYYLRNLQFRECANLEIANITQTVGTEDEGFDNCEISGSYTGFLTVNHCADVEMHDCSAWARRYDAGGRSTYGITLNSNTDISLTRVNCSNPWEQLLDIGGRRWGITGTNHNKHIVFDRCTLNRIDAHEGFYDMTARDCKLGSWGFRLTGQGPLTIERCDVYADTFITLRSDYGSTWDGDAHIVGCTHHYWRRDSGSQNLVSVTKCYDADGTEHDFGYEQHHPNLYVENLTVDEQYFVALPGDYLPFRTVYGILSNYDFSNADKFGEDYWPDTVKVDGIDFVNYEDTIGYEPHLRMPVNEAGAVMEKLGGYSIENVSYNGMAVEADIEKGERIVEDERSGSGWLVFRDYTLDDLGENDIAVEYSGSVPALVMADANWKGWPTVEPYRIERGDQANVAYFSNAEIVKTWKDLEGREKTASDGSTSVIGPMKYLEVKVGDSTQVNRVALLRGHGVHEHSWVERGQTKAPTCTEPGARLLSCSDDERHVKTVEIAPLGHSYGAWKKLNATQHQRVCTHDASHKQVAAHTWDAGKVTKTATTKATGVRTYTCATCGGTKTATIAKLVDLSKASVTLSSEEYVYNASVRKPSVKVKLNGKAVASGNYTVAYSAGCKDVGSYKVTVKGKGVYGGSKSVSFKIVPKSSKPNSVKAAKRGFTAKWAKQAIQTSGYQLQYATKSNFKSGARIIAVSNPKTVSCAVKGLKAGKKYWVRVRTFKKVGSAKFYSGWSSAKTVKAKR